MTGRPLTSDESLFILVEFTRYKVEHWHLLLLISTRSGSDFNIGLS